MVPGGSALHEFLVYDEGSFLHFPQACDVVLTRNTAKDKERRKIMKERTGGKHH
jgi:acetolactate synthase-1/2/3 large subunit